jgi:hypothetical protein
VHAIRTLFVANPSKSGGQHFGSRLAFLADGTLLMSVSDGGNPPQMVAGMLARDQAQNLATDNGKLVRLTDEGKPAPGNPLAARPNARPEMWTYGHRNIQGLVRDRPRAACGPASSLLDTDLYKFTMWQPMLHRHPQTQAEYRFVCRNTPAVPAGRAAARGERAARPPVQLRFQRDELAYLAGLRFIKSDFVDFLRIFHFQRDFIHRHAPTATR